MKTKAILIIAIGLCTLFIAYRPEKQSQPCVDFYDVTFLRDSPAVEKVLKDRGFFEVDLTTKDNLTINTIMLDQSSNRDVKATIISCPGFVPGRKEGMTTLYAMLQDQPYNFIFIDSRGHGKSDGELLTLNGIKEYGKHQYLDIVATLQFIAKYNKAHNIKSDMIIHGLCAGAFHTIKAVAYIKQEDPQTYACIKGIIFDSGWPAIIDVAETVVRAEAASRCKTYNISFLEKYAQALVVQIYRFFFKEHHSTQDSILQAMNDIDQPILFIHADDDLFVPKQHVLPLIATAKKPAAWFVQDSSHVANHLKHKEKYKQQMQEFIHASL